LAPLCLAAFIQTPGAGAKKPAVFRVSRPFIPNSSAGAQFLSVKQPWAEEPGSERPFMLKKVAAIGLIAAFALSPLAAVAQTDTAAPAAAAPADTSMKATTPMKHKTHKAKKHTAKKSMAPAAPAAPAEAAPKS
jgi:hypothetical protein